MTDNNTNINNFSDSEILKLLQTHRIDVKIKSLHEYSKYILRADVSLLIKADKDTIVLSEKQISTVLFNENNADTVKPIIKNIIEKFRTMLLELDKIDVITDGKAVIYDRYGLLRYNTIKICFDGYLLSKRNINVCASDLDSTITEKARTLSKALAEHLPYILSEDVHNDEYKKHMTEVNTLFEKLATDLHNCKITKKSGEHLFVNHKQIKKGCLCTLLKVSKKKGKVKTGINEKAILNFINAYLLAEYNNYRAAFMHELTENN